MRMLKGSFLLRAVPLLMVALLGALWVWSGSDASLAVAVRLARYFLPPDQVLEVKQTTGSVRSGGRIGLLRWQDSTSTLEARDMSIAWDWQALLDGELRLPQVQVHHLRVQSRGQSAPVAEWVLPVRVDAHIAIATVQWLGSVAVELSQVKLHYTFDGSAHRAEEATLQLASGRYRMSGQLQGRRPMATTMQISGRVGPTVGPGFQVPAVDVVADVHGNLFGPDAMLDVTAKMQPEVAGGMHAELHARLMPAHPQPVVEASGRWGAVNLAALWPQAPQTSLSGAMSVRPQGQGWQAELQLANARSGKGHRQGLHILNDLQIQKLSASGVWRAPVLQLDRLHIQAKGAQLRGELTLNTASYAASGKITASVPGAQLAVNGHLRPEDGNGKIQLGIRDAGRFSKWLQQLSPELDAAHPVVVQGAGSLSASWQGGWQRQGENLHLQAQFQGTSLSVTTPSATALPLLVRDVHADLRGTLRSLSLSLAAHAHVGVQQVSLVARAQGGQGKAGQWNGVLDSMQLTAQDNRQSGPWALQLDRPLPVHWQASAGEGVLEVAPGSMRLSGPTPGAAQILWQGARWSRHAFWQSQGQFQGVPSAWLELLAAMPLSEYGVQSDLLFGGTWRVYAGRQLQFSATLERTSGDLQWHSDDMGPGTLQAGVREARVAVQINDEHVAAQAVWSSEAGGNAQLEFTTRLQHRGTDWVWAKDAPLAAKLHASLPRIGAWSMLAPPGWRAQGAVEAHATLSGNRAAPAWAGHVEARDMALRSVADGVDFSQGALRARLDGQRMHIDSFTLRGAGGSSGGNFTASGTVDWPTGGDSATGTATGMRAELDATLQAFRVSARADRRLVVSGRLSARFADMRLALRGALSADKAMFVVPEDSVPALAGDVVVHRAQIGRAPVQPAESLKPVRRRLRIVPDIEITLDPGNDFQLQGAGLKTRLGGLLVLKNAGGEMTPLLTGELHAVNGTYRAYGQLLNIDHGALRFTGPYDNPALDILALRPNLAHRVGVQLRGTAKLPLVRLFAEPELSDADKLSWLVLGRLPAGGGAEAALLQQAAVSLLSGKGQSSIPALGTALGLDEVSLGELTEPAAEGSKGATATTVRMGKRLTGDFYLLYERSLSGTMGTFYVFHDLSKRLTLRGESGQKNAVDLIFTTRFD